jgi:hypothetical protein
MRTCRRSTVKAMSGEQGLKGDPGGMAKGQRIRAEAGGRGWRRRLESRHLIDHSWGLASGLEENES